MRFTHTAARWAAGVVFTLHLATSPAWAQAELSALSAVSALPVASVVVGASTAAAAVAVVPVALSTAGAVLVG